MKKLKNITYIYDCALIFGKNLDNLPFDKTLFLFFLQKETDYNNFRFTMSRQHNNFLSYKTQGQLNDLQCCSNIDLL